MPLAVAALKEQAAIEAVPRLQMERSFSQDIREERRDLKEAAEHSLNVILDLSLDGTVKWVTQSWKDVIGTPTESVVGKPIADILIDDKNAFTDAVQKLQKDDSRSLIVRFSTRVGSLSLLSPKVVGPETPNAEVDAEEKESEGEPPQNLIQLEAQGIVVYDRTSGEVSHVKAP